jgi:hypothetical protein
MPEGDRADVRGNAGCTDREQKSFGDAGRPAAA